MPRVVFTSHLKRYLPAQPSVVAGNTVQEVLDALFSQNPQVRGYILDEQDRLREHVVIFVDGQEMRDRRGLSDALEEDSEVFIMQALSGGALPAAGDRV